MSFLADILVALLLLVGGVFTLLGSFSLVKLSSFYTRLHGPTKATTLGAGCILLASAMQRSCACRGPGA